MSKKLIIIDNGNIQHKAIFAFRNHPEMPFLYTYLRMIIGYLKKIGTTLEDKVILAQDYGTWRKTIDPLYKAQRQEFREGKEDADWWKEVYKDFNEFTEKLSIAVHWHFVKVYHCEADDVASVAVRYLTDYEEIILVSSDEDWQMLCAFPNVKIFSPYTKKYKEVKNPEKILLKKIKGDISDNLLEEPKTEAEYEKRKTIVNLLELPDIVENGIKEIVCNLPVKQLAVKKVPFRSCQMELIKLYKLE